MPLLEATFNASRVHPTIDFGFPQTYVIAATISQYRSQMKEYAPARKFGKLALELSKHHVDGGEGAYNSEAGGDAGGDGDVCVQMQLGTMFDYFPSSELYAPSPPST